VRIEPNAHRILAGAEHDDVAHAGQPRDLVLELDGRVIGEVEAVVARVGRRQRDDLQIAVEFFCTMTPCACTAWGSEDSAADTRFCTSTCAMSRSAPILNVTVSE